MGMLTGMYRVHGEFCATHPWEVIVATLTLAACIASVDHKPATIHPSVSPCQDYNAIDTIVMTAIRCIAVLYSYYQFRHLNRLGSKYILSIAGLFTVFSSFVFSSSVINFLGGDISDLKDALFFFLLLVDLSKATALAQFALSSSNHKEVKTNIAHGMSFLGPSLTLDAIVETLVISVGTLSGMKRLEVLCYFACMSVVVNYLVFMTFYPACLSLILELSRYGDPGIVPWHDSTLSLGHLKTEDDKPNPVVQRVKIIMSAGLVVVHLHSHWTPHEREENIVPAIASDEFLYNSTDGLSNPICLMEWISVSVEHIVVLILLLALSVKFIFFEDKDELIGESHSITKKTICDLPRKDTVCVDKALQTDFVESDQKRAFDQLCSEVHNHKSFRSIEECLEIYKAEGKAKSLTNKEVEMLVKNNYIQVYQLESVLNNPERGVFIRRQALSSMCGFSKALNNIPFKDYDYNLVLGACCENVIGYVGVPLGLAGPLLLDGEQVHIPLATTEGCLVASTSRGCRALASSGVTSALISDGMTRAPVVRFLSIARASEAMLWMQSPQNFPAIKEKFDSTSRFAKLTKVNVKIAGRHLFIRFIATTGDAMGMNMVSKGSELALHHIQKQFTDMEILSLSGNFCSDKKPSAVNWLEGRGKSVVCQGIVPSEIVNSVLKTTTQALVDVSISKNLIGSAIAGSIGGFNAHAANVVTAIYIATGQDPAQNVSSSNCMTLVEPWGEDGQDVFISCTMPSLEIGTVGGGTLLPAQAACLDLLGVRGPHETSPGENANKLARIICGAVLAGELSLMAALASGHLVRSHLKHNRSSVKLL